MSANFMEKFVSQDLECGISLYIMKPSSSNEVQNLWQHLLAQKASKTRASTSVSEATWVHQDANRPEPRRRREQKEVDKDDSTPQKKHKVRWTNELQEKFLEAINHLGLESKRPYACFLSDMVVILLLFFFFSPSSNFNYYSLSLSLSLSFFLIFFSHYLNVGAVPKRVSEFMNVPGLTRHHVASHLQVCSLVCFTYAVQYYHIFPF